MDCVTDHGDVFFGYSGELRWKHLKLPYSSTMYRGGETEPEIHRSLRNHQPPRMENGVLTWSPGHFGVRAQWSALAEPIDVRLLTTDDGFVDWRCTHPYAAAKISLANGRQLNGKGYAEYLQMSLKPWKLPIDELRWGRFLSEHHHLVWIDWKSDSPKRWLFHNGVQREVAVIDDDQLILDKDNIILSLNDRQVIREGAVISSAFGKLPFPSLRLPLRQLNAYECKWRSWGTLRQNGMVIAEGWAIHEVVKL